jgi:hypothetical protein
MSYPFLPVNPCCTDVVINDPCGCNSVITNTGCNNNNPCSTHLTASSTIVYDGPILPCIVAEPCDTLNVILQKIDEIICNLLTQINYLNNQVINITNQIITINGDIINIYNILDECCGATTTTTSTTIAIPCESFSLDNTGEDPVGVMITDCDTGEQEIIVLLPGVTNICVETDSPLTVPGTIIVTPNGPCGPTTTTTSSTSSTSSTTTTTTTAIPCECITIYNSADTQLTYNYKNCDGVNIGPINIGIYETVQVCGSSASGSDIRILITIGANCVNELCPTTTTTTTIVECTCYNTGVTISQEVLDVTDNGQIILNFNDCDGNPQENIYDTAGFYLLGCANFFPGIDSTALIDGIIVGLYVPITVYEQCCPESPTTTTSSTSSTTSTTTTIEPTTTTTTTLSCVCYTFYNTDIVSHEISYKNCSGVNVGPLNIDPDQTIQACGGSATTDNFTFVIISEGNNCIDGICPPTTTTTTTLTPV